jgi:transposase-like protein
MNNIIEQDHCFIKKRIVASQWFRSVEGAVNTIQGYEAMHMIVCPAQGWCIQRELSPPGQESEAL